MQTPYYFLLLATCSSCLLLVVFHVDGDAANLLI